MPLVSVIIPTYNRADLLPRAIKSVLSQTFEDFEVIVVDDNSTDDTAGVLDQFDDARIQYVSHARNKGGSAARNTGIERATGNYIAFLDSDDEWLPLKLEQQVSCLESRSEEWVAAYCGYRYPQQQEEQDTLRRRVRSLLNTGPDSAHGKEGGQELIRDILMMRLPTGGASTLFVRGDAIDRINGFDETFERHQDWEFLIRLLHTGKLAYVDEELMMKHGTGTPAVTVIERSKSYYFAKFEAEIDRAESVGCDVTTRHRFDLARRYFLAGNVRKGIAYANRSELSWQQCILLMWCMVMGFSQNMPS